MTYKSRARSTSAQEYHKLYNTKRWQLLRLAILTRDLNTCALCGCIEGRKGMAIVNHKTPHKGDPVLFWDENNLETMCKPCHDGPTQRTERNGFSSAVGPDGWPIDHRHPANRVR
jgi:5-methylcytosine-specific restriction protein A